MKGFTAGYFWSYFKDVFADCSVLFSLRALAHSLLEKLDHYLWTPRPLAIGPQLLAIHQMEDRERPESVVTASPPAVSLPTVYMEDATCHWGVRLPSNR